MIISRTPLRISLVGGGTDFREFYKAEFGAVTSLAINKYVYITVNKRFDKSIRVSYSQLEIVDNMNEVKHNLVREAMRLTGVTEGVEITSIADIPSKGTGLASSSAFTVGLLHALYAYKGKQVPAKTLAEQACKIEIGILKDPIGKQDQYIVALGGIRHIRFYPNEKVKAESIACHKKSMQTLKSSLMLFYTGISREAGSILTDQKEETKKGTNRESLKIIKNLAVQLKESLMRGVDADALGDSLHRDWTEKKKLTSSISNALIDDYYNRGLKAGASGGKLLGAGGGGFLLFCCPNRYQNNLRKTLKELREMPFKLEPTGTKIIFGG